MGFIIGVYGLTYFSLLCSHLTRFYSETLTQMARYAAPVNLGFLILGVSACMENVKLPESWSDVRRGEVILPGLAALVILLCAGYSTMADCLIEGHDPLNSKRLEWLDRVLSGCRPNTLYAVSQWRSSSI